MPLESATYINQLVTTNPDGDTDKKRDGDDHIRLIKTVLKNTFPAVTGAVSATNTELNKLAGVIATTSEINALSGVTGNIQTQLNSKQAYDAATVKSNVVNTFTVPQVPSGGVLTDGPVVTWDINLYQIAYVTLGGNRTLSIVGGVRQFVSYALIVQQDGVGSRTLSFPSFVKSSGGSIPGLTPTPGTIDVYFFLGMYNGTHLLLTGFIPDLR